jgi:hypothetical protein
MKPCVAILFVPFAAIAADTNALPPLAPAYGELPPTFWEQHETVMIVGGFACLALAFLFVKAMLRPESKVTLPPEVLARQDLAKLQSLPENGTVLSEVSHILRGYLVAAFALSAAEMTTAEFCAALAANEKTGPELAQTISDFLRECDERKFSSSPDAAPLNAVTRALGLVSSAEARRSQSAPVTGAAKSQVQTAAANRQTQQNSDAAASGDGRTPR